MVKKIIWILIFFAILAISSYKIGSIKAQNINHLIISQIETGETTANEFVELYNPTTSTINLANYKLTRRNSGGITEANLVASLSGQISGNGYFLIGHGTGYTGSVPLDKVYSAPSNALTNNYSVRLYSDTNTLLDKVGYGTSPDSETLPFTINPSIGQSIRRINNQDTDNNSTDFELLTISLPRNSNYINVDPTAQPTLKPSPVPTLEPTVSPTRIPISTPTIEPTLEPFPSPTLVPTTDPISTPSSTPTILPTPTNTPESDHHKNNRWMKKFVEQCRKFIYDSFERSSQEEHYNYDRRWSSFYRFFRYNNHK